MKLGTNEPKKVIALGGLVVVAGVLAYVNLFSTPSAPRSSSRVEQTAPEQASTPAAAPPPDSGRPPSPRPPATGRGRSKEFRPVLRSKRPEDRYDPRNVDPTLRLDLLAKLQEVELPTAGRNLFQTAAPPPKPEPPKGPEPKIPIKQITAAPAPPAPPPGPPPPPPINLKYYGFSAAPGGTTKTAFFLDGDDILVAREGETLKRRYRVVRIGVNSVVMEDTESKHQQTLPLAEEVG